MARIAVAVSGGADSLYALLSLQEQGHTVMAVHGLFLPASPLTEKEQGLALQSLTDLCQEHAIPLHICDFRKEFDTQVITPFLQAYASGLTPNPCALCNARIKFGLLMQKAMGEEKQGGFEADFFATGHYAHILCPTSPEQSPLCQGNDPLKDQSYFLSLVPAICFEKVLFPLALTRKTDNIAYLQQRNISIPVPKESQEICFVPSDAYRDFVAHEAKKRSIYLGKPGPMYVFEHGEEIPLPQKCGGKHGGLWQYTEGQRRGLGVAWKEPLYVQTKDQERNALILSNKAQCILKSCIVEQLNFFVSPQHWPQEIFAKVRHRQQVSPAQVHLQSVHSLTLSFLEAQSPTAPGQIATLYNSQGHVLCGGIIASVNNF